ncbi:MAG TPA: hypothetical protein VGU20_05245 [Stellaceae bacterium]|nr:hypothetical protein [Stellaceae bacterium]
MAEFLERLTSGRTVLLIAVAVVLVLRLSASQERHQSPTAAPLDPAPAAQEADAVTPTR